MKKIINSSWLVLLFAFALLVFVSSCKKKYDYHIKGTIIKATTQEPLEGVIVEVYDEICQGGLFNGGCGPNPDDFHSTTTNAKGEFEMILTSEEGSLIIKFNKVFMSTFNSGLDGSYIVSGTSILNEVSMSAEAEEFSIEFEPSLPNVEEVTLGFEWNYFQGGIPENVIWGTFPSHFTVFNSPINPRKPTSH